jgi:methionyl-tRNA synthetase
MAEKYFDFAISSESITTYHHDEMIRINEIIATLEPLLYSMQTHRYLEEIWKIISIGNKAIEVAAPWAKMKEGKTDEAMAVVALSANILAKVALMLSPIMPKAMEKIASAVAFSIDTPTFEDLIVRQELLTNRTLVKIPPLFPKIEEEKKDAIIEDKAPQSAPAEQPTQKLTPLVIENPSSIDDFFATQIKVGTVLTATEMPKSKKLLVLTIDLGESRPRQILAGIKEFYTPEDLIGTQVCVVANLAPAQIMGMTSEGMVLASKDENGLSVVRPQNPTVNGSLVR